MYKLVQAFKAMSTTLPQYISLLFQHHKTSYSLQSTLASSLFIPKSKKQARFKSFQIGALRVWNQLPAFLRNSTSLHCFKKHLNTYFYNSS